MRSATPALDLRRALQRKSAGDIEDSYLESARDDYEDDCLSHFVNKAQERLTGAGLNNGMREQDNWVVSVKVVVNLRTGYGETLKPKRA